MMVIRARAINNAASGEKAWNFDPGRQWNGDRKTILATDQPLLSALQFLASAGFQQMIEPGLADVDSRDVSWSQWLDQVQNIQRIRRCVGRSRSPCCAWQSFSWPAKVHELVAVAPDTPVAIRVDVAGYQIESRTVQVKDGETKTVEIELQPK